MGPAGDVAAVILAGGKGSRFGVLGQVLPKCLLPLPGGETLLTRLIGQLEQADIRRVAVCCSPDGAPLVESFLEHRREAGGPTRGQLWAVPCEASGLGPLPALAEVLSAVSAPRYLLVLADVVYAKGPFAVVTRPSSEETHEDGVLLCGADQLAADGAGTGFVRCSGTRALAISYRSVPPPRSPPGDLRWWSGGFCFRRRLVADLQEHVAAYRDAPLEDWIQGLLDRGARCECIDTGPFVNVNAMPDYRFLLGTLGARGGMESVEATSDRGR